MKSTLIGLLVLSALLPTYAQRSATENSFTPQQLQQDFGLTRQLFETMHPALYDLIPKDRLNHLWDSTGRLLDHKMTSLEFFKLLSLIVSQLGCGHTAVGLPTRESDYIERFLPVKLKFLKGKAYIVGSYDSDSSLVSSEVFAINGQSLTAITDKLFLHISTDGLNPSHRYMHLDNKFDVYYALHIAQPDTFKLLIRTGTKPTRVLILPATTKRVTRSLGSSSSGSPKPDLPFYMSLPNAETAVLTIDQFYIALDDDKAKEKVYKQFLDSCFTLIRQKQVKKIGN